MLDDLRYGFRYAVPSRTLRTLITIAVFLLAIPVGVVSVQSVQQLSSNASTEPVKLSFSPATLSLPPSSTIKLIANTKTAQVSAVQFDFQFDPSKVNLASEISTTGRLKDVIQKTSMEEANTNGRVSISLRLSQIDDANPPSGIFELANVSLVPVSDASIATPLMVIPGTVSVFDMSGQPLSVTTENASLSVNMATDGTITRSGKQGDTNNDGVVNSHDIQTVVDAYGGAMSTDAADVNGDGKVDIVDIGQTIDNYGN